MAEQAAGKSRSLVDLAIACVGSGDRLDHLEICFLMVYPRRGIALLCRKLGDFKDVAGATDYSYDVNGNMTLDNNKGITQITYNHLNCWR